MSRISAATPEDLESIDIPHSFFFEFDEVWRRINAFLDSFADASNPCCCPYCFAVLVYDIEYNDTVWTLLQRCGHKFMETCLRLLVIYTETSIPPLRERLRRNQMECAHRAQYHRHRLNHPTNDPVDMLLQSMLFAIGSALTRGDHPVYSDSTKYFHKRKGYWPLDVAQLFPLGIERGMDSLVHWCCVPPSGIPFSILSTFIVLARPVILPKLLCPQRRERFVWALLQAITPGSSAVPWVHGAPSPFTVPAGLSVSRGLRGVSRLSDAALSFLKTLRLDVHAHAGDPQLLLAGYEQPFLGALERLDQTRPVDEHFDAAAIYNIRRYVVGNYCCALRTALGRPHAECHPGLHTAPSAGRLVGLFLIRRGQSRYCANQDCTHSEIEAGRLFQQCAACKFVRYCDRACQRYDWKHGAPAHKAVCPALRKVLDTVDPLVSAEEFEAGFNRSGLDEKEVGLLTQWVCAGKLVPRLAETKISSNRV